MPDLILRRIIKPFGVFERRPKPKGSTKYVVFKGNQQLMDFGRYSAAIRWAKQQLPRPEPHIVINFETKEAVCNVPISYTILDGEHTFNSIAVLDPERVAQLIRTMPIQE